MRKTVYILLAFLALSCSLDDAEYVKIQELDYALVTEEGHLVQDDGTTAVPAEGGSVSVRILSNGDVTVTPKGGVPKWAQLEGALSFQGDQTLTVTMDANEGFRRGIVLEAAVEGMDPAVIVLRQEGIVPELSCLAPYLSALGSVASQVRYDVQTNIPSENIECRVSDGEWLTAASVEEDGNLQVSVPANSAATSRKAQITLSYTDGWNQLNTLDLYLTQASASDTFGVQTSFQEVRSMTSGVIKGDYTLSGLVISDYRSPNMEENPVLTLDQAGSFRNKGVSESVFNSVMQAVDTTASARTAYLESEDGSLGMKLVFDAPADNRLVFGTRLTLSLEGATLVREDNPVRYTLKGVKASQMLHSELGAAIPEKSRTIGTLADEDLYTFVSLSSVEFPVKEGSYTDIRENHALWSRVNDESVSATDSKRYFYMDGYANLLTDQEGNAICAPVNMLCTWRKPEDGIPQGAGTAKGILVHNSIPRYGDAGKYQLRVIDESGFEGLGETSAWTSLAKWDLGKVQPSAGTATLTVTKPGATVADEHSYKSRIAATKRTCGISDTYRSIRVNSPVSGWYNWAQDGTVESYNGVEMDLSTEGLSGNTGLMLSFRFYAGRSGTPSTFQAFPSHWCVDYSLDGGETFTTATNALITQEPYVHLRSIATYTLQWGSFKIPTSVYSGIGATCHAFLLPVEVLGRSAVKLRIRPYDTVLSIMPSLFTDDVEASHVTASTTVSDYVSFQDIIISYR